jgi:hypothetical protein
MAWFEDNNRTAPQAPGGFTPLSGLVNPTDPQFAQGGAGLMPAPGGGVAYNQVIVNGPNGWWKSSPDPSAPWHGPNGEVLPAGQSPPGAAGQAPPPPGQAPGPTAGQDPRDPRFTSANAPRVQQNAQGQWVLTEHGNTRNLQGQEVQDATTYANQFWTDNPTGFQMNNPLTLPDAYQQFLGRAPDAAGLAAHQANPGGTAAALQSIMYSPEAMQYRAGAPGAGPGGGVAGGTVMLRAPNGQTKAVPADQVAFYLQRGATRM